MSDAAPLRLLVAVDGSAPSLRALDYALRLRAEAPAAELVLVAVREPMLVVEALLAPREELIEHWSASRTHERLRAVREKLERAGASGDVEIVDGVPAEVIVARARELGADLVLMGSRGLNPLRELALGSVAKSVLALADCPVVVVR
ncbi:MAG: universal stress protein [Burkholderiales bacterium]|nr:universal stress protein [Burkholderiales bacterium]